jgi:hypothetical protein
MFPSTPGIYKKIIVPIPQGCITQNDILRNYNG